MEVLVLHPKCDLSLIHGVVERIIRDRPPARASASYQDQKEAGQGLTSGKVPAGSFSSLHWSTSHENPAAAAETG